MDNYDEDDEAGPSKAESGPDTAVATMDDKDSKSGTTVPRHFFGHDCKIGDRYTVRVSKILDNEILVNPDLDGKDREAEDLDAEASDSDEDDDSSESGMY